VHIREAMRATARGENPAARELMGPVLTLPASMPVARAVTEMRAARAQLALVEHGELVGIAALEDLLEELIGDFEDETDTRPVGVR
jgi:CBS domain containing-hemolysin-like protein